MRLLFIKKVVSYPSTPSRIYPNIGQPFIPKNPVKCSAYEELALEENKYIFALGNYILVASFSAQNHTNIHQIQILSIFRILISRENEKIIAFIEVNQKLLHLVIGWLFTRRDIFVKNSSFHKTYQRDCRQ